MSFWRKENQQASFLSFHVVSDSIVVMNSWLHNSAYRIHHHSRNVLKTISQRAQTEKCSVRKEDDFSAVYQRGRKEKEKEKETKEKIKGRAEEEVVLWAYKTLVDIISSIARCNVTEREIKAIDFWDWKSGGVTLCTSARAEGRKRKERAKSRNHRRICR